MTVRQLWVQDQEYNAIDDRTLLAALLPVGAHGSLGSAVGLRAVNDLLLTMTTGTAGTVSKGAAFINAGNSIYCLTNDAAAPITIGPSDPTLARIDILVAQVNDPEVSGSVSAAEIKVIAGIPSATPVAPATPAGALLLNTLRVNAGSTAPINTRNAGTLPTVPAGYMVEPSEITAIRSTGLNLTNMTWGAFTWSTYTNRRGEEFTSQVAGIRVETGGRYFCEGFYTILQQSGGRRGLQIYTSPSVGPSGNPSSIVYAPTANIAVNLSTTNTLTVPAGGIITMYGYQDSGATQVANNGTLTVRKLP